MTFGRTAFYKSELLLAVNRLIHLDISISITKFHGPPVPSRHSYLNTITTSGETTLRCLFQRGKLFENNYNF